MAKAGNLNHQTQRAVQYLSDEQLAHAQSLSPEQVVAFLEDFRLLFAAPRTAALPSTAISIRVSKSLLNSFRQKCVGEKVPYQSKIKDLMESWIKGA